MSLVRTRPAATRLIADLRVAYASRYKAASTRLSDFEILRMFDDNAFTATAEEQDNFTLADMHEALIWLNRSAKADVAYAVM